MKRTLTLVTGAVLASLFATAVQSQTITFEGTVVQVNDPSGLVSGISIGDPFAGSLEIIPVVPFPVGGPMPSQYLVSPAGSVFVGPHAFDPYFFGQPWQLVRVGNEVPLLPPGSGIGDTWGLQGFIPDSSVIAGMPFCFLSFQTLSPGPFDGEEFVIPSSLAEWPSSGPPYGGYFNCVDLNNPSGGLIVGQMTSLSSSAPPSADAGTDRIVECSGPDGAVVMLDGSGSSPAPPDGTYVWTLEGAEIATGVQADVLLSLGDHTLTLTVSDDEGRSDEDSVEITVEDTAAPAVSAEMIQSGENGHMYTIVATATDVCDPVPTVEASVGASVSDGGTITIAKPDDTGVVRFMSSMVELEVTATDASGNSSTAMASP